MAYIFKTSYFKTRHFRLYEHDHSLQKIDGQCSHRFSPISISLSPLWQSVLSDDELRLTLLLTNALSLVNSFAHGFSLVNSFAHGLWLAVLSPLRDLLVTNETTNKGNNKNNNRAPTFTDSGFWLVESDSHISDETYCSVTIWVNNSTLLVRLSRTS